MTYYLDLFSPETYEIFVRSGCVISGFRMRQQNVAKSIQVGDRFICYITKLSRWVGILEVTSPYFIDQTPLFQEEGDPYICRFNVRPIVFLDKEHAIPIHDDSVWHFLSFTKGQSKNTSSWTGKLRASLNKIDDADGIYLEKLLHTQAQTKKVYPLNKNETDSLATHTVRTLEKTVAVSVPEDKPENEGYSNEPTIRESIKIQALLAKIGATMGMRIWLPRNDKAAVLSEWNDEHNQVLSVLPLNYDTPTLKTIELIDVLWLKGRSIVRAFEVEHTTSIYSGILRMADLLALQPNMNIKLHIVAPSERREKVFQEVRRPVFSLLEQGPLSESCTYISYDSLRELEKQKHLSHFSDSVLDEYAEDAE